MSSVDEFGLIQRFFQQQPIYPQRGVILGIGDDAAVCAVPASQHLAVAIDTLVAGVHFPKNTRAYDIGYKTLAVNLSDMAAMGATPAWFTLALTCPTADTQWLTDFSQGLFALAQQYQINLIGGDTTRGALTISIQIAGFVPRTQALTRSGAQVGDGIYVTGSLGDAGLGLQLFKQNQIDTPEKNHCIARLNRPTPQVAVGQALRTIANSAIDISDGLAADLNHILTASKVGADLNLSQLPLSSALTSLLNRQHALQLALHAGDDYELCFTVPSDKQAALKIALQGQRYCQIGTITAQRGLRCYDENQQLVHLSASGYQHF
jgi:thiamine-monophosphate kinase